MQAHAITHVVAKNGGGAGARAKLDAARALGLPVILIDRPQLPPRKVLPERGGGHGVAGSRGRPRGVDEAPDAARVAVADDDHGAHVGHFRRRLVKRHGGDAFLGR